MAIPELAEAISTLRIRVGPASETWCDQVSDVMADLISQWQLSTSGEPARAGYGGICLPVRRLDATPGMLKVTRTTASRDLENEVLARWNGHRAARLLERDDQRHARLLQRLDGPSLADDVDPVSAMSVAGDLALVLAVEPPPGVPRMSDVAIQIAARLDHTPVDKHRSLSSQDVQAAAATFRELGAEQPDTLLHGDLQGSNILRAPDGGWAVIDPLGLVGEPALEALTVLRDRWTTLRIEPAPHTALLRQLHAFADAARTERSRVVAWTHARCVRAVVDGVSDDQGMHAWVAVHLRPGRR